MKENKFLKKFLLELQKFNGIKSPCDVVKSFPEAEQEELLQQAFLVGKGVFK